MYRDHAGVLALKGLLKPIPLPLSFPWAGLLKSGLDNPELVSLRKPRCHRWFPRKLRIIYQLHWQTGRFCTIPRHTRLRLVLTSAKRGIAWPRVSAKCKHTKCSFLIDCEQFLTFLCKATPRVILQSVARDHIVVIQKFCYHGNVTSYFSPV